MSAAVVIMPAILLTGTRATGFVVVSLLSFDTKGHYYLGDLLYMRCTKIVLEVLGEVVAPTPFSCLKQFWNRYTVFLQCEQVTTAEGVDVTTIADSRPFALREGPFRISLFVYMLRIVVTARSSVKYHRLWRCVLLASTYP